MNESSISASNYASPSLESCHELCQEPSHGPSKAKYSCFLVFGAPGVGKGTICKFLGNSNVLMHISSGDIFRGIAPESTTGRLINSYISKGLLLPDPETIAIWRNYVSGLIFTNRYYPEKQMLLLDGIPRNKNQAEILDQSIDVKGIILLEVKDKQVLFKRLQKRAILEKRVDDSDIKTLETRMQVYENETRAVLEHYPENLVYRVNADQKPFEVIRDVLIQIASLLP